MGTNMKEKCKDTSVVDENVESKSVGDKLESTIEYNDASDDEFSSFTEGEGDGFSNC